MLATTLVVRIATMDIAAERYCSAVMRYYLSKRHGRLFQAIALIKKEPLQGHVRLREIPKLPLPQKLKSGTLSESARGVWLWSFQQRWARLRHVQRRVSPHASSSPADEELLLRGADAGHLFCQSAQH
jgi:hypothetical protein